MALVHFVQGKNSRETWLQADVVRALHLIYIFAPRNSLEFRKLCCKSGLCPVILARSGLTFKAAS